MKYLKQKNISKFSISDQTLIANDYGRAVMDLSGALRLPKGTTSQRPNLSGVRTLGGEDGYIRYNTSTHEIEAYIDGAWETVRSSGPNTIIKRTFGPGNDVDTDFGPIIDPITPPSGSPYDYPIIVLVENVIQISGASDNYLLDFDYGGSGQTYITFNSPVPNGKYITIYLGFNN